MPTYHAYRVFMNKTQSIQVNLFGEESTKEERFRQIFLNLKDNHKASFSHYGTELYMYFVLNPTDHVHIWHLAKRQEYEKPMAGDEHIEKVKDEKYPFIHIVIHIGLQLVLVEKNTTVFQQIDTVKNKIETYFNICLANDKISAVLNEITDQRDFWSKINELDLIEDIELDYAPPNFFGAGTDADKLVKEVHEETRFRKFQIHLQNRLEGLKFDKDVFETHISRLASGAGQYQITGLVNGFKRVVKSASAIWTKTIEHIENYSAEEWEKLFGHIHSLNEKDDYKESEENNNNEREEKY